MAAELVKGKFGSSSSKLEGVAAALLPSRDIDSCARRKSDCSFNLDDSIPSMTVVLDDCGFDMIWSMLGLKEMQRHLEISLKREVK